MSSLIIRLGNGRWGVVGLDGAARLLNNDLLDTEEIREDTPINLINTYSYKGLATAGTATSSAVWSIVRYSFDSNGQLSRIQYRTDVVWDSRASGWS